MSGWIYLLILFELIIISWVDIKTKKISNIWPIINIFFCLLLFLLHPDYLWSWQILLMPALWMIVGFVLFQFKIMGAGDSKLLASLFLLLPLEFHALLLTKIILVTLVTGSCFLLVKIIKDFKTIKAYALTVHLQGLRKSIESNFSYAPVILLAWLWLGAQTW
jgi:prepilin peptidase CpaA